MRLLIRISVTPTLNVPPETVLVPRYAKCMKPVHWRRWSSQAQLLEHRGNTHKQWRHNAPTTNHFWCTPKVERKREREREKNTQSKPHTATWKTDLNRWPTQLHARAPSYVPPAIACTEIWKRERVPTVKKWHCVGDEIRCPTVHHKLHCQLKRKHSRLQCPLLNISKR